MVGMPLTQGLLSLNYGHLQDQGQKDERIHTRLSLRIVNCEKNRKSAVKFNRTFHVYCNAFSIFSNKSRDKSSVSLMRSSARFIKVWRCAS